MSYSIVSSKRFLKAARKYARGGKEHVLHAAEEAVYLLSVHDNRSLFVLSERWRDHQLRSDKRGIRELHLGFDDLLLYRRDEETKTVELLDIVSHEDLEKM